MAAFQRKSLGQVLLRKNALHCSLRQSLVAISTFNFQDLKVSLTQAPQAKPDEKELLFGHNFTDHMLTIDWSVKKGWSKPFIHPVQELRIHPAAKVLHYATELFEGMKGYRCVDGKIRLFRPMENMKRMRRSAERAGLPDFDAGELLRCVKKLISIDSDWVPRAEKCSLYVRPTFIATEPTLGVSKSTEAKLFVLLSPVGPYFRTGFKPVTLLADPRFVRAWPGGCGSFKMGANYAPTIQVQDHAMREMGCHQVLWLFGDDHKLTEVGTMNLFLFWINEQGEEELVTPPLHGLILPGVTRKSLLELSYEWNEFKVTERDITMKEVVRGLKENRIMEMFGAGTACVVCPIEKIMYQKEMLEIPTMKTGKLTNRFLSYLTDIQYGRIPHLWMEPVDEDAEVDIDLRASRV